MRSHTRRSRTLATGIAGAIVCTVLLAACSRTRNEPEPRSQGATLPRIAVLSPGAAEAIRRIGRADRIIARHGFDTWTDQSIPVAGDQQGVDYEQLLDLDPTHIIIEFGATPVPDRLKRLALDNDWHVQNLHLHTLEDIADMIDWITARFDPDTPPIAPFVIDAPADSSRAWLKSIDARSTSFSGTVLLIDDAGNALGPGSYHHQILERIGAQPAISTGAAYIVLDAEDVLDRAPDAIIMLRQGESRGAAIAAAGDLPSRFAPLPVPAIMGKRVGVITHPMVLVPGPALADIASDLADLLDRWSL